MGTTPSQTQRVLASMFTENTGSHFLDSGGAYGRAFERQRGKFVEDFIAEPEISFNGEWVTLSAFHWLTDRLEFDPKMNRKLRRFAAKRPDDYWTSIMGSFAAQRVTGDPDAEGWERSAGQSDYFGIGMVNSYNYEDSLSQTIQFTMFIEPDSGHPYVLLQIHGGCDVRGGYTAPRAFRVDCDPYNMLDFDNFTAVCTNPEDTIPLPGMPDRSVHALDFRNTEITNYEGEYVKDPWDEGTMSMVTEDGVKAVRCPYCETPTPMALYTVEPD